MRENNSDLKNTIYDKRWKQHLPEYFTINYHGKLFKFKKDNTMLHSDMVQITYASTPIDSDEQGEIWGTPDTLEFDIYFAKEDNIVLNVDITYGDAMACEFSVEAPNKVLVNFCQPVILSSTDLFSSRIILVLFSAIF